MSTSSHLCAERAAGRSTRTVISGATFPIGQSKVSGAMSDDELVERVAEAIHATEYGRHNPAAVPDHNQWTWHGFSTTEPIRDVFRVYARAAILAVLGDH